MPKSSRQQLTKLMRQDLKKRWTSEDGISLIRYYARSGLTFEQMEERNNLPKGFISKLASGNKKVARALNEGAELVNAKVENKLLQKALGYTKKKTIVGVDKVTGRPFTETIDEEVEPNFSAIAMWLNNSNPEKWKRGDVYVRQATIKAEQEIRDEMANDRLPTEIRVVSIPAESSVEDE